MTHTFARQPGPTPPSTTHAVSRPHDPAERQAHAAADVVARGGSVAGWQFAAVRPSAAVHREEAGKPAGKDDTKEYREAATTTVKALLETEEGKRAKELVLSTPLVKQTKQFFTTPIGLGTGGLLLAGGLAGLAAAKQPLPFQLPAVPLEKVHPALAGITGQVVIEGPLNAPTFVGLTLTFGGGSSGSQRSGKEGQRPVQRETAATGGAATRLDTSGVAAVEQGGGRPLEPPVRRRMEARFGHDFSAVRVHDDTTAHTAAHGLRARAFTVGEHVGLATGTPGPSDPAGLHLLAHELAHVVQQGATPRPRPHSLTGRGREAADREPGDRPAPSARGGAPLEPRLRREFEPLLGVSLAGVRIHADGPAAAAARSRRARAYTVGQDVRFAAGAYRPDTSPGRWLLAHELVHVVQASRADGATSDGEVESEASEAATALVRGRRPDVRARSLPDAEHRFGEPDRVPDHTFVSTSGEQGFLRQATAYHRTWGLAPRPFRSMQALLHELAQGRGRINRLRIVSHANFDNLFTPLFTGGADGITEDQLNAFGESEAAGIRQALGGHLMPAALRDQVVARARAADPAALRPFGLDAPGSVPTGAVARLVRASADLLLVTNAGGGIPAAQRATLAAALTRELAGLRAEVAQPPPAGAGVTGAQALGLQNAITGVAGFNFNLPAQPADFVARVQTVVAGLGAGFMNDLLAVRARLTGASWIDLRGCRVGQRPAYLAAVARFFGSGATRPHVSGPDLFQSYPRLGWRTVPDRLVAREAGNADVMTALDHWAVVTGIRERLTWWLRFLGRVLHDEALRLAATAAPTPPALSGGLRLRLDPFLLPPPGAPLTLTPPRLGAPPRPGGAAGFGGRTLQNPLLAMAQRDVPRYTARDGELRYYLEAGLPLPVQSAARPDDIRLLLRAGHEREAVDSWLASQWSPAAPGLPALQAGRWSRDQLFQVEAVSDVERPDDAANHGRTLAMWVSPDPGYDRHIQRT